MLKKLISWTIIFGIIASNFSYFDYKYSHVKAEPDESLLPSPTDFFNPNQEKWDLYFNLDNGVDPKNFAYSVVSTSILNINGKAETLSLRWDQLTTMNTVSLLPNQLDRYNTGSYVMYMSKATLNGRDINFSPIAMGGGLAIVMTVDPIKVGDKSTKHTDWGTVETSLNVPTMKARLLLRSSCPLTTEHPNEVSNDNKQDCTDNPPDNIYRTAEDISSNWDWLSGLLSIFNNEETGWAYSSIWSGFFKFSADRWYTSGVPDYIDSESTALTDIQALEKYLYYKSLTIDQDINFSTAGFLDQATVNQCKDKVIMPESASGWSKFDAAISNLGQMFKLAQANSASAADANNIKKSLDKITGFANNFKSDSQGQRLDVETYRRWYSRLPVPGYPELFIANGVYKQEKLEKDLAAIRAGYDPNSQSINNKALTLGLFGAVAGATTAAGAGATYGLGAASAAIGNTLITAGASGWLSEVGLSVGLAGEAMTASSAPLLAALANPVAWIGLIVIAVLAVVEGINQHIQEKAWAYQMFAALLGSIYAAANFQFKDCVFNKAPEAANNAGITANTMKGMAQQVQMQGAYAANYFNEVATAFTNDTDSNGCPNILGGKIDPFSWIFCEILSVIHSFLGWLVCLVNQLADLAAGIKIKDTNNTTGPSCASGG